jgi:hypothetical protein
LGELLELEMLGGGEWVVVVVCLVGKEGMRNFGKKRERRDWSLDMVMKVLRFGIVEESWRERERGEGREVKLGVEEVSGMLCRFIHSCDRQC